MTLSSLLLRLPRRHILVALTFLACVIAYTDRVNISVAAVAMREQFGWSQTQKGLVLSAFFVGYLFFMFASGLLAARFGGKRVLGGSVLAWSIFTLLTPPAAMVSIAMLIAARIGMGMGEAAMFPAAYELFGHWTPASERARAVARVLSGIAIGTVIGLMGSGWLVGHYGWPMAFYVFGVLGLVWVTVWFRTIENDPATDPRLSAQERALLVETCSTSGPVERIPLRLLLRAPVLAIVAGHVATAWTTYVLIS
jgi:ACS family sodium-dependent inorganic phosphate cotransporter